MEGLLRDPAWRKAAPSQPRLQCIPQGIKDGADWPCRCANEIDILRIAQGFREDNFVEGRAASESQLGSQQTVVEDFDERAR